MDLHFDDEIEQRHQERTAHLEAANRELEGFVSSISHDLRGPLRSILGFTRIVLEEHAEGMDASAVNCLDRVQTIATRIYGGLEGRLRLYTAGQKGILKSTVDLGRIGREVIQRFRQEEPGRDVECVIQEPLIAIGDEVLLAIVVENLLGNAWKFTSRTLHAKIEFTSSAKEGRTLYIVNDNGIGFDESQSGSIFKPSQHMHHHDGFPGEGVGLATVQKIINRHGGRIRAEGKIGAGAKFCFSL